MQPKISRREFLKLMSITPLVASKWPSILHAQDLHSNTSGSPNIIILVFDAFSAPHASIYDYQRKTTPNLERFANRASVYHNHYAGGNFTTSGTASLLTGTYPWTHRAIHIQGTVRDILAHNNIFNLFGEKGYTRIGYSHNLLVTTLLYQFRKDLETFKWTRELALEDGEFSDRLFPRDYNASYWGEWMWMRSDGESAAGSLYLSLLKRFYSKFIGRRDITAEYGDLFPRGLPNFLHGMHFILEDAIDWVMEQLVTLPQPYLIYLHVLPPHDPYTTRVDFVDKFDDGMKADTKSESVFTQGHTQAELVQNRREYDEYIAYADAEFGRLYDFMLSGGILDNTCFVVTSDHGEMFERGILGHITQTLYQPITRIPLLFSMPGQVEREDIFTPTSCVDILPTLLHLTGQEIPDWCEGQVLPNIASQNEVNGRSVFTVEAKSSPKNSRLSKATYAMVRDRYKLIHYTGYRNNIPPYELFDIIQDPEERTNLFDSQAAVAVDMQRILQEKLNTVGTSLID